MFSDKEEVTSFNNEQLRDQWEKRAQSVTDNNAQETDRKERSALNGLFTEWHHRLSLRNGLVSNAEKKKGDTSDFRKYVLSTEGNKEVAVAKPVIRFKIKPPPKIVKPEPPPPPPPRKKPPPKPHRPKRKVEVDLLKLCWGDSWKSLKPPKHLQQKSEVSKTKFSDIELTHSRMYKPVGYDLEARWGSSATEWTQSWKQAKSPGQLELCEENHFQWEILSEGKLVGRYKAELNIFALPVWAGTWKTMIFVLRQQKQNWDRIWPDYKHNPSNKLAKLQHLEEQAKPSGWEDSWKLANAELKPQDNTDDRTTAVTISITNTTNTVMEINDVFLPGWNESWLLSGAPLENEEELHKNWCSSWGYWQEIRWCKASLESQHRHIDMLMSKRKTTNLLLTSGMHKEVPDATDWGEAWTTPKAWSKRGEYELEGAEEEEETEEMMEDTEEEADEDEEEKEDEVEDEEGQDEGYYKEDSYEEECELEVPLHLQFHKLNTSFPSWKESWRVSKAHRGGEEGGDEEGQEESSAWKDSWKLCILQEHNEVDVVCFSTKNRSLTYMRLKHAEDSMPQNEWSESWKTTKPADVNREEEEICEYDKVRLSNACYYSQPDPSSHLLDFPLYDWNESWKFTSDPSPSTSYSFSYWSNSWKLSNPNSPEQLDHNGHHTYRQHTPKCHRHYHQVSLPQTEWADAWKHLKLPKLHPSMPREEQSTVGEWGACWRLFNPQIYLKKEAWCQEKAKEGQQEEKRVDLRLHLSFLPREEVVSGNRKLINPKLSTLEWNESWRFLKVDIDTREK